MQVHRNNLFDISLVCILVLTNIATCYAVEQDPVAPDTAEGVAYFENHVRPLLANHCYKCHSSRTQKREGGLLLDSRSGWAVGGDNGPSVIPGKWTRVC
jgi:hypothetical protein